MRTLRIGGLTAACIGLCLLFATAAAAHVTAQPPEHPAGGYTKVTFRAPNERDVPTVKVEVQFDQGIPSVSVQPVPGWTYTVNKAKLDKPVESEGGESVTEYVSSITWSGGKIMPGEFHEFPVSVKMPDKGNFSDTVESFPTLQTYQGGEVVSWIEQPDSADGDWYSLDKPAPHVTLTSESDAPAASGSATTKDTTARDDAASARTIGIVGLVVGLIALVIGGIALMRKRK